MPDVSFAGLLVVAVIALGAPLLVGLVPAIRVPAVVLEIVAGIVVGPSVLGWVEIDVPIQVLAVIGLAFLLFLAGLEIDLARLRGRVLRLTAGGFALTLGVGLALGVVFQAAGFIGNPLFLAIVLAATSLGLVVPVLKDAGQAGGELGQLVIAAASVADFGAVILLTLFFSGQGGGTGSTLVLLGGFVLVAVAATLALTRVGRSMRLEAVFVRLQDTTAEIRVRLAVVLLIAFVALAERLGLETILGAFLAGAILNLADRDAMATHPHFRLKLEAVGYGFLVPVFFVTSGLRFDLGALTESPSALARVPLLLAALLLTRGLPAALYAPAVGRRATLAAALLQATSLPFIVTTAEIGRQLGLVSPATAAGLVSAGLLSVVAFPPVALGLLRMPGAPAEQAGMLAEGRPL
jgi:Kef-type K+ transport system membrane component KefB